MGLEAQVRGLVFRCFQMLWHNARVGGRSHLAPDPNAVFLFSRLDERREARTACGDLAACVKVPSGMDSPG